MSQFGETQNRGYHHRGGRGGGGGGGSREGGGGRGGGGRGVGGRGRGYRRPEAPRRTPASAARHRIAQLMAAIGVQGTGNQRGSANWEDLYREAQNGRTAAASSATSSSVAPASPYAAFAAEYGLWGTDLPDVSQASSSSSSSSSSSESSVRRTLRAIHVSFDATTMLPSSPQSATQGTQDLVTLLRDMSAGFELNLAITSERTAVREALLTCALSFPLRSTLFATVAGLLNAQQFEFGKELVAVITMLVRRSLFFSFGMGSLTEAELEYNQDIMRPEYENREVAVLSPELPSFTSSAVNLRVLLRFCAELVDSSVIASTSFLQLLASLIRMHDQLLALPSTGSVVEAPISDQLAARSTIVSLIATTLPWMTRIPELCKQTSATANPAAAAPGVHDLFAWLADWERAEVDRLTDQFDQEPIARLWPPTPLREQPRDSEWSFFGCPSLLSFVHETVKVHKEAILMSQKLGDPLAYSKYWRMVMLPIAPHVQPLFAKDFTDVAQHSLGSTVLVSSSSLGPLFSEAMGPSLGDVGVLGVDFRLFRDATVVADTTRELEAGMAPSVVYQLDSFHRNMIQFLVVPETLFAFYNSHRDAAQSLLPQTSAAAGLPSDASRDDGSRLLGNFAPLAVARVVVESLLGMALCWSSGCHGNRSGKALADSFGETAAPESVNQRSRLDDMTRGIRGALASTSVQSMTLPALILADLCTLAPAHFPPILGQAIDVMFRRISNVAAGRVSLEGADGDLREGITVEECAWLFATTVCPVDASVVDAFSSWFAYHLSQFDLAYDWDNWGRDEAVTVQSLTESSGLSDVDLLSYCQQPARHFVLEAVTHLLRLSYRDRVAYYIGESIQRFLPPVKPGPRFRWPNALAGLRLSMVPHVQGQDYGFVSGEKDAQQLLSRMLARESADMLHATFLTEDTPHLSPASKCDMVVQCILFNSAKTFTHFLGQLERYVSLLLRYKRFDQLSELPDERPSMMDLSSVPPARSGQVVMLDSVADFWRESPQHISLVLEKFLAYAVVDPPELCEWVIGGGANALMIGNEYDSTCSQWLQRSYWWEVIRHAIGHAVAGTQAARSMLLEAENKLAAVPAETRTISVQTRFIPVPDPTNPTYDDALSEEKEPTLCQLQFDRAVTLEDETYAAIFLHGLRALARRLSPETHPDQPLASDVPHIAQQRHWCWYVSGWLVAIAREFGPRARRALTGTSSSGDSISILNSPRVVELRVESRALCAESERLAAIWGNIQKCV